MNAGKVQVAGNTVINAQYGKVVQAKPDLDKVKKFFDGSSSIGGGCGLTKLRPYLAGNGLYQGDDKNPFRDRLPTNEEADKLISGGKSSDVRDMVVNCARSKVGCKEVGGFFENTFKKIRDRMCHWKDDVDGQRKKIRQIEEQLDFLDKQFKDAQKSDADIRALLAQVQDLNQNSARAEQ